MNNKWVTVAAMSGFFCVAFGAFAAHILEKSLSPLALSWIDKGLKYQMFHTLTLFAIGLFQIVKPPFAHLPQKSLNMAALAWCGGILCFSGSLYALALGGSRTLVWITPIGGTLFLLGWLGVIYFGVKKS